MSPLTLVGILVITTSSFADVSHVLTGSAQPPESNSINPHSVNRLASREFWWMNSDSPLKAAYDYYKKCSVKGTCLPPVNQNGVAPQPFLPQPAAVNINVKKNPFLNGNYRPSDGNVKFNVGGAPKVDIKKNPFLSGQVVIRAGNGLPIAKNENGFLGVQPAQPFGKKTDDKERLATQNVARCDGDGFMCVKKDLCIKGLVNNNGGLLHIKSQSNYCDKESEVCCKINNLNEVTAGKSSVPESTIKFAGGAGFSPGLIHVQPLDVKPDIYFGGDQGHHSGGSNKDVRDTSSSPNAVFGSTPDYSDTKFDDDIRFASTFQGPAYLPPLEGSSPKPNPFEIITPNIRDQFIPTRQTPSPSIQTQSTYKPYQPAVTPQKPYQPSITPQQTYQPSVTPKPFQPSITPQKPYQPTITPQQPYQPSITPQQPYQPSITPKPYQPSITFTPYQPSVKPQKPYEPTIIPQQPYQPSITPTPYEPSITPQKPYQPGITPQKPYQPSITPKPYQPSITPQRPYTPSIRPQQPYQPSVTPEPYQPSPSTYRPTTNGREYLPPSVTPQQPYQPSVTPKPYQPSITIKPYQPSITPKPFQPDVTSRNPFQPYQPSVTPKPFQPSIPQKPYGPSITPKPYQPYQPSPSSTTIKEYLPPSVTPQKPYQPSISTPQRPFETSRPYQPSVTLKPYQPSIIPKPYQPSITPKPYQPNVTPRPYQPSIIPQETYQQPSTLVPSTDRRYLPPKPSQPFILLPSSPQPNPFIPETEEPFLVPSPSNPKPIPQPFPTLRPFTSPTPKPYQPYEPPVTQPTPKPYQPYQPPVTQPTPKPYQPYQPPVTQPTPKPYQPYQPTVTQPTPKPYQPYQPPVTQPTPKPYQPPVTQPTPKPYQPYQPPVTQPTPKPYQPYQPPVTQPTPKPYQPYQPPVTQPTPKPYQPYQPPVTQPTPKPYQPYEPPATQPTPKPYQPLITQPTPKPYQPYEPPATQPTSKPYQPYQPPVTQPTPKPYQPYQPPVTQPIPRPLNPADGYHYPVPTPTFGYPSTETPSGSENIDNQYVPAKPKPRPENPDQNPDASDTVNGVFVGKPTPPRPPTSPTSPTPPRPYTGEQNTAPPAGCAAALKCVQEIYCTAEGIVSPVPVVLSKEQELSRVPTTVCQDTESGIIGKCCRDPNYKDPWPSANLVNGVDDGQYKEDDSISFYQPNLQRNVRANKGGPNPNFASSNINSNVAPFQPPSCGERHENSSPKGSGPLDANFAEIPWQAMILRDSNRSLLCGGVIVKNNAVLTAAHCVDGLPTNDILIKGGEWKLGIDEEPLPFQIVSVAAVIRHPQYQKGAFVNDLALLMLEEKLRLTKNVGTLCLPPPNQIPTENCIATGWGKRILQLHAKGAIMHSIDVKIMNNEQCKTTLENNFQQSAVNYSPNTLCGYSNINQCKVDYGSALACSTNGQYTLSGIYAWDTGCKQQGQIGGYIAPDVEWIQSTLSKSTRELRQIERSQETN